jgi:hypothetical protein
MCQEKKIWRNILFFKLSHNRASLVLIVFVQPPQKNLVWTHKLFCNDHLVMIVAVVGFFDFRFHFHHASSSSSRRLLIRSPLIFTVWRYNNRCDFHCYCHGQLTPPHRIIDSRGRTLIISKKIELNFLNLQFID